MVKKSADGKPVVVPSATLVEVTKSKATEIERKVGGKVVGVKQKIKPVKPTSAPQVGGKDSGLIAGIVVAVGLIVVIAAVTVWYFRYDMFVAFMVEDLNGSMALTVVRAKESNLAVTPKFPITGSLVVKSIKFSLLDS